MAARGMSPFLKRLLDERRLIRSKLGEEAVKREIEGATYDLQKAKSSLAEPDFKWATVKAYYSMFHAARALLYVAGYRERSHAALLVALRELYVKTGKLAQTELDNFENAINLRQEADYALTFSEEGARRVVSNAEGFIQVAKNLAEKGEQKREDAGRKESRGQLHLYTHCTDGGLVNEVSVVCLPSFYLGQRRLVLV